MLDKSLKKTAYRWLMQHSKPARLWIRLTIGVFLCSGLLLLLQASLLAHVIDRAYIHRASRVILTLPLIGLFGVMLLRALLGWLREVVSFKASALIRQTIRNDLYQHVLSLGPVQGASLKTGETTTTALEQIEALHGFFANYLPQMAIVVFLPFVILAFVFPFDWMGGLILLITAPLIPVFMVLIGMGVESLNQRHFQSLARLGAHFLDILQGLTTLKLFMRSQVQLKLIGAVIDEYREKAMRVLRVAFLSSGVLELFSSIAIAILAVFLGLTLLGQVHYGHYGQPLTLYKALFILLLAPEFFLPLRQLGVHYHARAEAIASAHELLQIFKLEPVKYNGRYNLERTVRIKIRLQQISFAYPNQPTLLKNLNVLIEPGKHVAIIGPSGAGKSTLFNLLCGFILPDQGEILINRQNLSVLCINHWHQQVAWLEQNPRLFQGSIRENIRLAKPSASDQEIELAAESAQVLDFVEQFPNGLDTLIGEQNYGLSGGQAQRVALARVYLSNKPVLLLDEPTASLDHVTEKKVLSALQNFVRHKTVISISHRPDTIIQAEQIFKLVDGGLVEVTATLKSTEAEYA